MFRILKKVNRVSIISEQIYKNIWKNNYVRNISFVVPRITNHSSKLYNNQKSLECNVHGIRFAHTKSEKELIDFLSEEIVAEQKARKTPTIPTSVEGFGVKLKGADVELVKQIGAEKIVVSFNVNHTVDADDEESNVEVGGSEKPDLAQMRSKPQFEVDIIRGKTTLSFTCSFLEGVPQEGEYDDVFGIDELCIYEGDWSEKIYAVAGDVLDGYLYDLLMNLLEEKGINNNFADKLSDFSTAYEHSQYITLLERLSKFTAVSGK